MTTTWRELKNNLEHFFSLPSHEKVKIILDCEDSRCFRGRGPFTQVVGVGTHPILEVNWDALGTLGTHILPPLDICVLSGESEQTLASERVAMNMMVTIYSSLKENRSGSRQNEYCEYCLPEDPATEDIVYEILGRRRRH